MKLPKIYTKNGDLGTTTLYGDTIVKKDDLRVVACGEVYYSNTLLGLCASLVRNKEIKDLLLVIQNDLFLLQGEILDPRAKRPKNTAKINSFHVKRLESIIDEYYSKIPRLKGFILPGGTQIAALFDTAVSAVRKAECYLVALLKVNKRLNPEIFKYINRLSDLLFVLARYTNARSKNKEIFVSNN